MRKFMTAAALAASALVGAAAAQAEPLKIGMMVTLSGPPAALGEHIRDGFMLGIKHAGGKLGGQDTEVIVVDDELKPDVALTKVKGLLERDEVDFVTGIVFSNILQAIFKPVTESETFLIGANAGTSTFAGRGCNEYFFSTSWQNDTIHEVMGKYAQDKGYKRAFLMAPNYQAGKDSITGFKRYFEGEVVDEVYTKLGQLDFSAELARIAAAKPDVFFTFMPGGMGVNLVKQYRQAGLVDTIPFLSAFTVDGTTLPATKDAALGLYSSSQWAPDLDNEANKKFVADFVEEYGYMPSLYASQGYDAAQLIDSAVKAVDGDLSDKDAVIAALKKADFASVRGDFSFNNNHFPIEDYYLVEAVKRDDGFYAVSAKEKVFDDYGDVYAKDCPMK
ncbi:ABC transporter substrate-binding protein [Kaustia mangrovi]|uniref:ABC transporter substrate-binding protein n=1 Tax=Kaustia mangrovi TaxID=2593653 RepID=A0A7S8C4F9_9HYPH|nr:ABC transporter substrate-binding protein [Kaustia mangrovi]QPC43161.1 ABC transporter substrate-binding protein [Kaustia mangrovi]